MSLSSAFRCLGLGFVLQLEAISYLILVLPFARVPPSSYPILLHPAYGSPTRRSRRRRYDENPDQKPETKLTLRYNVTPSAAYQYAPAYKRYGHKISAVHFIGQNKPWSNIQYRPAGISNVQGKEASFDCKSSPTFPSGTPSLLSLRRAVCLILSYFDWTQTFSLLSIHTGYSR